MDLELQGKVALVAGSSRGIGLAIARAFLAEGASVVVTGRDRGSLDSAFAELSSTWEARRIRAICGDMTVEADIAAALDLAEDEFNGLDAVVANVGSGVGPRGHAISFDDWERALRQNLLGGAFLAGQALDRLVARCAGSLTLISSIAGIEALDAPVPYAAAKAGIHMAMKSFARQVGPNGVRVNAVAPGNVVFAGGEWDCKLREQPERFRRYVQDEVALQRFASPEEIADVVLFLASARASFVTGAVWIADGGQTRSI